ncbi:MAG: ATP-binding cassette domain-containing protein [Oliverpabstia sp.]
MDIVVKNAVKYLGSSMVIDHINLAMHSGQIYGFQGINGCGKTMLMRLIAGLIYPTQGEVIVDGKILHGQNSFPKSMGLLIENPQFLAGYSGYKNLYLLAGIRERIGKEEVKQAMYRVKLDPEDKKKYRKYSLGMKQRLGIACAIMEHPELIILDEPFISLDEEGILDTKEIIRKEKERGAIIILACHDYELLSSTADEIFRLTAGKITKHLIKNEEGKFREVTR